VIAVSSPPLLLNHGRATRISEENKQVVNRIPLEILNQGKVDVADEVMAADMIEHMAPAPGLPSGIEGSRCSSRDSAGRSPISTTR
jgi:hypothetical protein